MNVMRYTIIDRDGTVSFVARCEVLPAFVAACADGAISLTDLLKAVARADSSVLEFVECGLAVFDEHNVDGNFNAIRSAIQHLPPHELPVFRVVDDATRQASLQGVKAGVIIFNLRSRRIVQIQNTYAEIRRMAAKMRRLQRAGWTVLP